MNGVWAIPALTVVRIIRPIFLIRFATFRTNRLGHFGSDALIRSAAGKEPSHVYTFYWLPSKTSNSFWAKMVKRRFLVSNFVKPLWEWNRLLPLSNAHYRASTDTISRDIYGDLERNKPSMRFTDEELKDGYRWLESVGWNPLSPIVCLLVRDNSYLDLTQNSRDWSYHDYRNSNIATYELAADWLATEGAFVFRMGVVMGMPLSIKHPRIIDYAFRDDRSDFLDIFLFANCDICISTGVGPDTIADGFRKPILQINLLPLTDMFSWSDAIHVPKNLFWRQSGQRLSVAEHITHNYHSTGEYDSAGIDIGDLPPQEILSVVQERWMRMKGTWIEHTADVELQSQFLNVLKQCPNYHSLHKWIHPKARVGSAWLRSMADASLL